VFILPSHIESFGIVYVEAMACGKPVIATDCGGPADFVNQSNGRLIPVENVDSISDAIEYFSINLSDYSSEKIREFFTGNYSGQAVCPKIISTYEKLLQK
jgi:glycosyltransferase involved in cell wall biosynthesis